MKRLQMTILIVFTILIVGCTGMEKSGDNEETTTDLPDKIAAQDEFTRTFLVSTDEVSAGHYAFKTWTEAYTMWIPVDAKLSKGFYEKREKHWERFSYAWLDNEENLSYGLFAQFEDRPDSEEIGLEHLSDFSKFEGEYSKKEDKNNIYYYGKRISEVGEEGEEKIPVYSHIGFIKHKNSDKALGILFDHHCSDWTTNCNADTKSIEDHFWKLVKSVKFED
ncbi:hypothetical protein H7992_20775 [Sporosarcina sp. resist]|uniref:hypothetical protein n=1 Tax=Sporosarcina sp. resist TaxID=2762563 RepID=UPI00164D63D4|nr:hypothetical protein [Sporosarcina sp. resist]QNK87581.1 hypothetical protein H7992_20775 [Sporosarcina sp. resist]